MSLAVPPWKVRVQCFQELGKGDPEVICGLGAS